MRVRNMRSGPPSMMEASIFSKGSRDFRESFRERNRESREFFRRSYGERAEEFFRRSEEFAETYDRSVSYREAEKIIEHTDSALKGFNGKLYRMTSIEDLRDAPGHYTSYLMAQPDLYNLYREGRVEGYSETYVDTDRNLPAELRPDYMAVTRGLNKSFYELDPKDEDHETWSISYIADGGDDLEEGEQLNAASAYRLIKAAILENLDPSSVDGLDIRDKKV